MQEIIDTFGVNWKLLVAQAVNFGLLLAVLSYFLYKPLLNLMRTRAERIEKGINDAEKAELQLQDLKFREEETLTGARKDAEKIVGDARSRAKVVESEIMTEAREKGERIVKDAESVALDEKERAVDEARDEIAKLAVLGAEQVLKKRAS